MAVEQNLNLIDYPCSYSWRAYYQETMYGEYLPALEPPELSYITAQHIEPEFTRHQWDMVRQIQNHIIDLENKIMELRAKKKEEGKYLYE